MFLALCSALPSILSCLLPTLLHTHPRTHTHPHARIHIQSPLRPHPRERPYTRRRWRPHSRARAQSRFMLPRTFGRHEHTGCRFTCPATLACAHILPLLRTRTLAARKLPSRPPLRPSGEFFLAAAHVVCIDSALPSRLGVCSLFCV
eukprot:2791536-Pleurochrysis_carterae.AAC.1